MAEVNIGFTEDSKPSSRVLKPPGGHHSNIFDSPDAKPNPPRPKYNQQNSSNLNAVMGTADPNIRGNGGNDDLSNGGDHPAPQAAVNNITPSSNAQSDSNNQAGGRVRVPPGGFSSGLW